MTARWLSTLLGAEVLPRSTAPLPCSCTKYAARSGVVLLRPAVLPCQELGCSTSWLGVLNTWGPGLAWAAVPEAVVTAVAAATAAMPPLRVLAVTQTTFRKVSKPGRVRPRWVRDRVCPRPHEG